LTIIVSYFHLNQIMQLKCGIIVGMYTCPCHIYMGKDSCIQSHH